MKKLSLLIVTIFFGFCTSVFSQNPAYPSARLLTLDGTYISSSEILENDAPTIMIFWSANEQKCCDQIALMIDAREKLEELTNVNIIAICTNSDGLSSRLKPFVNGKDWDIDVYIDYNSDFKRAMNIPSTPFTIVFNEEEELICEYNGYCAWADDFVCERIKECLKSEENQELSAASDIY